MLMIQIMNTHGFELVRRYYHTDGYKFIRGDDIFEYYDNRGDLMDIETNLEGWNLGACCTKDQVYDFLNKN